MTDVKISGRQLIALLILVRLTPQTLNCTTLNIAATPQSGLVADMGGAVLSVPLVYAIAKAGANQPGKTLIGYARDSLGPLFGLIAGVLLVPYFLVAAVMTMGSIGNSFSTTIMPDTPMVVFVVTLAFLATNAARNGVEVVGRLSETLTPVVVSALLLIGVLSIDRMDLGYLKPLYLQGGYQDLALSVGSVFGYYTQFILTAMLIPHLNSPKSGIMCSLIAVLITSALITSTCIAVISTFGPATNSIVLHAFTLARAVSLGPFFERFEVMMMAVWTIGAGVTVAAFIWAAAEGIGELLSFRTSANMAYPLGWVVALLSLIGFTSTAEFLRFAMSTWIVYSTTTAVLVVGLSLLTIVVNRRKGSSS